MKASERFAQKAQQLDADSYKGKLKVLCDVMNNKYPLPKEFPTTTEKK